MKLTSYIFAGAMLASTAQADQYAIGTLPQGSGGYVIAAAIASTASDHTKNDLIAVATGGSNLVLPQVNSGEMDFATSNMIEAAYATNGTGNFEGMPLPNIRVAAVLPRYQVGFLVRQDSDIQSATDLVGRRLPTQYSAMKMIELMQDATLAAEGLDTSAFEPSSVPNFAKAVELLTSGRVDAAFAAATSAQVREADAAVGIRFLGIQPTEGGEAKMQEIAPGSYLATMEPGPGLIGVEKPLTMFSYEYTLLVGTHVPDDVVHDVVKALYENQVQLAESSPHFKGWDPQNIFRPMEAAAYHTGALAFFKDAGLLKD